MFQPFRYGSQKVSNLNGLNFSVDNPDSVQAQARATAIADAKSKAQTLASQLGIRLGRIVNFSGDNSLIGSFVDVKIIKAYPNSFLGEL